MNRQNAILIFDIGKTNKKIFLFDEEYKVVFEQSQNFDEIKDEDGFPCENIEVLSKWIKEKYREFTLIKDLNILGVNFSAYGASMIHLGENKKPLTPLYNYLKPFPEKLENQFFEIYGNPESISKQTASPVLGSLNSGLQLYRLKYEQPKIYNQVKYTLHLPQYLSYIISAQPFSEITSIGCHTMLWDFENNNYHQWVYKEGIHAKFPPILQCSETIRIPNGEKEIQAGIGFHDSSSALIPYLISFKEPFILLSTGTWNISFNPFNHTLLSNYELNNDCLCYLNYSGKPVKASRLFAGYEHEEQVNRLAAHFNTPKEYYKTILFDACIVKKLLQNTSWHPLSSATGVLEHPLFNKRSLQDFENYQQAYHELILDLIIQQVKSTKLVLNNTPVKNIFVDGGFSKNQVFMNLLACALPYNEIYASTTSYASASGAALAMHKHWNKNKIPSEIISLKPYIASNGIHL